MASKTQNVKLSTATKEQLIQFQCQGSDCDISIRCIDGSVKAHSSVIKPQSTLPLFPMPSEEESRKCSPRKLAVPFSTVKNVRTVLDVLYTDQKPKDDGDLHVLMSIAKSLGLSRLKSRIRQWIDEAVQVIIDLSPPPSPGSDDYDDHATDPMVVVEATDSMVTVEGTDSMVTVEGTDPTVTVEERDNVERGSGKTASGSKAPKEPTRPTSAREEMSTSFASTSFASSSLAPPTPRLQFSRCKDRVPTQGISTQEISKLTLAPSTSGMDQEKGRNSETAAKDEPLSQPSVPVTKTTIKKETEDNDDDCMIVHVIPPTPGVVIPPTPRVVIPPTPGVVIPKPIPGSVTFKNLPESIKDEEIDWETTDAMTPQLARTQAASSVGDDVTTTPRKARRTLFGPLTPVVKEGTPIKRGGPDIMILDTTPAKKLYLGERSFSATGSKTVTTMEPPSPPKNHLPAPVVSTLAPSKSPATLPAVPERNPAPSKSAALSVSTSAESLAPPRAETLTAPADILSTSKSSNQYRKKSPSRSAEIVKKSTDSASKRQQFQSGPSRSPRQRFQSGPSRSSGQVDGANQSLSVTQPNQQSEPRSRSLSVDQLVSMSELVELAELTINDQVPLDHVFDLTPGSSVIPETQELSPSKRTWTPNLIIPATQLDTSGDQSQDKNQNEARSGTMIVTKVAGSSKTSSSKRANEIERGMKAKETERGRKASENGRAKDTTPRLPMPWDARIRESITGNPLFLRALLNSQGINSGSRSSAGQSKGPVLIGDPVPRKESLDTAPSPVFGNQTSVRMLPPLPAHSRTINRPTLPAPVRQQTIPAPVRQPIQPVPIHHPIQRPKSSVQLSAAVKGLQREEVLLTPRNQKGEEALLTPRNQEGVQHLITLGQQRPVSATGSTSIEVSVIRSSATTVPTPQPSTSGVQLRSNPVAFQPRSNPVAFQPNPGTVEPRPSPRAVDLAPQPLSSVQLLPPPVRVEKQPALKSKCKYCRKMFANIRQHESRCPCKSDLSSINSCNCCAWPDGEPVTALHLEEHYRDVHQFNLILWQGRR